MRLPSSAATERYRRAIARSEDALAVGVFWVLAGVVFLQFFTRYVLNDPIGGTEEIARYVLILSCYFGIVCVTRKDDHIRLELLERRAPPAVAYVVRRYIIALGVTILWFYLSYVCATFAVRSRQHMTSVDISLKLIWWPVFACFVATALHSAANFLLMRRDKS